MMIFLGVPTIMAHTILQAPYAYNPFGQIVIPSGAVVAPRNRLEIIQRNDGTATTTTVEQPKSQVVIAPPPVVRPGPIRVNVSPTLLRYLSKSYDPAYFNYFNAQAAATQAAIDAANANNAAVAAANANNAAVSAANAAANAAANGSTTTTISTPNGQTVNVATPSPGTKQVTIAELESLLAALKGGQLPNVIQPPFIPEFVNDL